MHQRWLLLAWTAETGLGKIADYSQNKSAELLLRCQLSQRGMKILAWFQLQGQGLHPDRSRNRARLRQGISLAEGTIQTLRRYESVSILKTLLGELQEQLQSESGDAMASDVTAAQVAEAAVSERLNITLAGGVMNRLKQQALAEGRSCSSLANFLIEDGLRRHGVFR